MGLNDVELCRTQKHGKICFFNQTGSLYFILVNFQRYHSFVFQKQEEKSVKWAIFTFLLFLRVQIFVVHLFALRYQIPGLNF